jgi:type I restriction enzyme S subunit
LAAIRASKSVDRDYLLYFLRFYEPELAKAGTGSTFAAISCEDLETVKIPLPPLPEQRRIADLLSRADRLRRLRRYADSLANSLLQSVFLEMFGDVRSNSKNLDIVSIGDCVKPTKQINPLSLGRSEFWYVDITTIDRETKTISQPNLIKADDAPSRARKSILSNDILVSTVRPNLNAVAKVPASLDGQIASTGFCVLRVNENKILSEYLFAFVQSNYFVDYLVENQTGANYPAVSDGIILDTPIPVPPLPQQEQFAAVVRRVESLRARAGESERQVEGLFQSLLAEAFTYL